MKASHFLIAAVCFVAAVTSCKEKNLPFVSLEEADYVASAKALLPSEGLVDTMSYLMGTQAGADVVYSFGSLDLSRVDKAVEDFKKISFKDFEAAAATNFADSAAAAPLAAAFEIDPALLSETYSKYMSARQTDEEGVVAEVPATLVDSMSYLYGILTGYRVAGMKIEYPRFRKGLEDFITFDTDSQYKNYMMTREATEEYTAYAAQYEIAPETIQEVGRAYQSAQNAAKMENYKTQSKNFFEKAEKVKGFEVKSVTYNVNRTDSLATSKILYRIDEKGAGEQVAFGDNFTVEYKGIHVDGSTFDEGSFPVDGFSDGGLIKGFTEALLLLKDGGKMTVVIPFELGYGERGSQNWMTGEYSIYPYETLVFELGVKDLVKPEPEAEEEVPAEELPVNAELVAE